MKKIGIIGIGAIILLGGSGWFSMPLLAKMQMTSVLRDIGFTRAAIASVNRTPNGYVFSGIDLDGNEFSTIETITLGKGPKGKSLIIDKLVLTADFKNPAAPDIAGWALPKTLKSAAGIFMARDIGTVSLNAGQMDLSIPEAGAIRLEAKGQASLTDDGGMALQSVLWSIQQQMKIELHITGDSTPDGIMSMDVEVAEGKINLPDLSASRMSGWMILNRTDPAQPVSISAQIMAGTARAFGIPMNGMTMTLDGNFQQAFLTLQAGGMETNGTTLAIDAKLDRNGPDTLAATLRAESFGELVQALTLRRTDGETTPDPVAITKTPGGVAIYSTQAQDAMSLLRAGAFGISDLNGAVWMKGLYRQTESGAELDLQHISSAHLASALGLDNFSISGTMTGFFPVSIDDQGRVIVTQGLIQATDSGFLGTKLKTLPDSFQTPRDDAIKLLKDFAYEKMEISVSGPLSGELEGDIAITGKPGGSKNDRPTLLTLHYRESILD